ncbi:MAG: hypothetical protein ACI9W6_001653 [Motiliproteus sp.]|jgi:hypothetical protein
MTLTPTSRIGCSHWLPFLWQALLLQALLLQELLLKPWILTDPVLHSNIES